MNFKPLVLAAAALLAAGSSQAVTYTYSGTTAGAPTFNRPFTTTSLSAVGTAVRYSALSFTVNVSGSYDFLSTTPTFDNFTLLYSPTLVASSGLVNLVALNDDITSTTSGFTQALTAGTAYMFVTTSYYNSTDTANANAGAFTNTITGAGTVTAVPEPQTYALMALGLVGVMGAAARRRATQG